VHAALELWRTNDPKIRLEGLRKLGLMGQQAASAVPALIPGVSDRDPRIRKETADVLRSIGPAARPAVSALLGALDDPEGDVRAASAWALQAIKPDARAVMPALVAHLHARADRRCYVVVYAIAALGEPAVPVLIDLLGDNDPGIRQVAGYALSRIGRAAKSSIPALVEALRLPDRKTREHVARALAGAGPEVIEPLTRALRDRDPKVRGGAAFALETLGSEARAAVPALVAALGDAEPPDDPTTPRAPTPDDWQREGEPRPSGYYAALKAIGPPAVPFLVGRLGAPDRQSRVLAMRALGFLGHDAEPAVSGLIALLGDHDLRLEAAAALGGIRAKEAVAPLVAALKDRDADCRVRAAETLRRIGWEREAGQYSSRTFARGAIIPLAAALKDQDSRVAAAAARALEDIGSESSAVISELVAAVDSPSAEVRLAALGAFGRVGAITAPSLGVVVKRLKDPDRRVRLAAARAVDDDSLDSMHVVEGLIAAMKDRDADVRVAAVEKLSRAHFWAGGSDKNGPWQRYIVREKLARPVLAGAALREALHDTDSRVRAWAAALLPVFDNDTARTVPLLTGLLRDPDPAVRVAAVTGLRQLGPAAKAAVPELTRIVEDDGSGKAANEELSKNAVKALMEIDPHPVALIDRLVKRLDDPDEHRRDQATTNLSAIGAKAFPSLIQTLGDARVPLATKVRTLGLIKHLVDFPGSPLPLDAPDVAPKTRAAIPFLKQAADDEDRTVRDNARMVLAALEQGSANAAETIVNAARAGDIAEPAFDRALESLDLSALDVMIAGLKDSNERVRIVAAYALAQLGDELYAAHDDESQGKPDAAKAAEIARLRGLRSKAIDALIPALSDSDTEVRWAAAWALRILGPGETDHGERVVQALIAMLREKTARLAPGTRIVLACWFDDGGGTSRCGRNANGEPLRIAAIQALVGFGERAAPAVPSLIDALRDGDPLTRWYAAGVLGVIGPKAKAAVGDLISLVRANDEVRVAAGGFGLGSLERRPPRLAAVAAKALGKIGPDARAAVAPLIGALKDSDCELRAEAAQALGAVGPEAAAAVPALVVALTGREGLVAGNAAESLGQIGSAAIPAIRDVLRNGSQEVRVRAMTALNRAGPKAAAAIPDLVRALADTDEEVRAAAAEALGQVATGARAAAAVAGLVPALTDRDRVVRKNAAAALGHLGATDNRVIPALIGTMRDTDREVRYSASSALSEFGMPAFPALRSLLRDDDKDLRDDAAFALSRIANPVYARQEGETGENVRARVRIPRKALFTTLQDPDGRVRNGASRALGYIGKDVVPELVEALKAALNNKLPLSRRNQPSSTEYRAAQFGNLLLSAP